MIVRKNQVVSSIFILTDGMLKIVAPEQERKKSIKQKHKLSQLSHEDMAAFEYLSVSNDSKKDKGTATLSHSGLYNSRSL